MKQGIDTKKDTKKDYRKKGIKNVSKETVAKKVLHQSLLPYKAGFKMMNGNLKFCENRRSDLTQEKKL